MKRLIFLCWSLVLAEASGEKTSPVCKSNTTSVTIIRGTVVEQTTGTTVSMGRQSAVVRGTEKPLASASYTFRYTGYDEQGSLVVTGQLYIMIATNSVSPRWPNDRTLLPELKEVRKVTGTWAFVSVGGRKDIGPQVGKGELSGVSRGSHLQFNLNPNMMDNNVYLDGELVGNKFSGTWSHSTIAGTQYEGKFTADADR